MNLEQSGLQMEIMLRVVNLFFFFFWSYEIRDKGYENLLGSVSQ